MESIKNTSDFGRRVSQSLGNMRRANWSDGGDFSHRGSQQSSRSWRMDDEAVALGWAALERLPTYERLRMSIMKLDVETQEVQDSNKKGYAHKEVDVRKMGIDEHQDFTDRIFRVPEEDNGRFLKKLRNRLDRVGVSFPTVEVRFEHMTIEAKCHVGIRALPSLANTARNMCESALGLLGIRLSRMTTLTILKDTSGIIKPSRMTLLLGPPSSGKTTLLLALAGKLDPSLKVKGKVTYNGHLLDEFVPQKTAAYVNQNDVHVGQMTVKETMDFSARCQGVGFRYEMLSELARREKEAGIFPDPEIDLFMKATGIEGIESSLQTYYTLRILGLDTCRNTIIGDEMHRGISGGERKRVTTGEMLVGPCRTLLMDEISTGLDSSTTLKIVKCLQQIVHLGDTTILMSLLQPAPETFDLFDDIILLSEGQIVYQGPREHVLEFFESCGFQCPERKGTADFLQEVISWKDQEQYWADKRTPYYYVSVAEFASRFQRFHVGVTLENEFSVPFDRKRSHKAALVISKDSIPYWELLKASFGKELLLMKRNSIVHVSRTVQLIVLAVITSTVFLGMRMHTDTEADGALYIGALIFGLVVNMFNGFAELPMTIARLPVFYKHRDLLFYPPWVYTLPISLLTIPLSIMGTVVWVVVTYFSIGFAPEASRFFKQMLIVFLIHQMATSLFRAIAGICRSMVVANTGGSLTLFVLFSLGGFILPKGMIPKWWIWGYWISPLNYAYNALAVNEMLSSRWMNKFAPDGKRLGVAILENFNVDPQDNWYWIGVGALLGFTIFFNVLFPLSLMYLNALGKPQAVMSETSACAIKTNQEEGKEEPRLNTTKSEEHPLSRSLSISDGNNSCEMIDRRMGIQVNDITDALSEPTNCIPSMGGMVLPFTPLVMSFDEVHYYVDMPSEMKEHGVTEDRLQLLSGVTGAFRPGILTALMGVSGAGKTTLLDVLAGRKSSGYIEGDIRISGFPKKQETFARIAGYCEQFDIHSPQVTVKESLIYSAFLRLPMEIGNDKKLIFLEEVMNLVELDNLKDTLVGLPGITGLSTEQRKRLTIAVELVANPSIIFMDEPTSGLDARAAAIVMRTVRNTVDTGRTVVCTIHQPSIDIFESFDELLLLKRGGHIVYSGPVGWHSNKIIEYFESIPGVPKIKDKCNPATWMLEVSSLDAEIGIDFSEYYKTSPLYQHNKALVNELSKPPLGASDLYFATQYCQSTHEQFKSCLWKQWLTYWRSPSYNFTRYFFTIVCSVILGSIFWKIGDKRESSIDLTFVIGSMCTAVLFVGINNCFTVQPVIVIGRTVFYRERAAGMYAALPYALAQVVIEIPYVFIQSLCFTVIVYAMFSFQWTTAKFMWFFFICFFSFLYFTMYGMMTVSVSPNLQVAAILAATFYSLFNLFSGFYIPMRKIPMWWSWYYWIDPLAWTVNGLITSQYGDLEDIIKVPGQPDQSIRSYIRDQYGYETNFIGAVAAGLVGFCFLFASVYAYCIRKLNFLKR